MAWTWIADFFGGAFLVNAVPHFVNGVSGRAFPTPFANPPGRGKSSPVVNVLWGSFNIVVGYLLLCFLGRFEAGRAGDVIAAGIGGLAIALMLARAFGAAHTGEANR
jgi:hypothetical protein